jgi:ATP-dependent exoDNAse (exonuclease V) beta subunit
LKLKLSSSINGFIRYLDERKEDLQQAGSNNPNAVKVLTYHKAKGLEWPIVILFDLQKQDKDNMILIKEHFAMKTLHNSASFDPANPLQGRYIRFAFWPMGDKENLNDYEKTLVQTPGFAVSRDKYLKEQQRLFYVGFTRARDYLITNSFNGKLDSADISINRCMGINKPGFSMGNNAKQNVIGNEVVLFDDAHKHKIEILADPVYDAQGTDGNGMEDELFFTEKQVGNDEFKPYYRNPSSEEGNQNCNVLIAKDFNARLTINSGALIGENAEQRLGNAFHALFALNDATEQDASRLLKRFGIAEAVNPEQLIQCANNFQHYLSVELKANCVYKEWPLEMKNDDGSVMVGSADLVVDTPEGLMLVDYKSYPGTTDNVLNPGSDKFSGRYAGQLNAYAKMLEATFDGKSVCRKLIYYPVLGIVVELT